MVTFVHGAVSDAHRRHNLESLRIREDLEDTLNDDSAWSHVGALKHEDDHYMPVVGYYPFKLSYWTDNKCCKIASSFTSIRDDVRYQGCDKSGTYVKDVMFMKARQRALVCVERMNHYHPLPNNFVRQRVAEPVARRLAFDDVNDDQENIVWREQFDSIHRDFDSAFKESNNSYRLEWMNMFGKYWLDQEEWCKDDIEMIRWFTMGANHATVDTCGEHLASMILAQRDYKIKGSRLSRTTLDNPSKLLKKGLGMQLPIKSIFKLRRDMQKFVGRNLLGSRFMSALDPFYWYYDGGLMLGQVGSGNGCEILLANNKASVFDECVVQNFHSGTFQLHNLNMTFNGFVDIYDMQQDNELNPITFQHSQMNMSRELITFAVGGPRFSSNGFLLPSMTHSGVCDCRHVGLSPLFHYHYELPTNLGAKWIDQHVAWLMQQCVIPTRTDDVFQDTDEVGYVSTQLTHLQRLVGYDTGNMLTFVDNSEGVYNLTDESVNQTFWQDVMNFPFKQQTDMTAVIQREPLNDPSVYVVNRRSLLVNKNQVFYNDDSSSVYTPALAMNALKWTESMLGDCSEVFSSGEGLEPISTLALNVDKVKMAIFGKINNDGKVK